MPTTVITGRDVTFTLDAASYDAQTIRDANGDDDYIRIAVKSLLEALEEYEELKRRFK